MAYFLGIRVEEIYLYPLGGISKFHMDLNINPYKEFLILITGPVFQYLAYIILISLLPEKEELIKIYHKNILFFNLLPIYPLDGGKLLKLVLEKVFPYRLSLKGIIYISYLFILIYFCSVKKIMMNNTILFLFLLTIVTKEYKKIEIIYQKFLLERYLKNYSFKECKMIDSEKNFYRNKKHLLKQKDQYILEKDYLKEKYKK